MEKTNALLKNLVGEEGLGALQKAIFRRGTQNVADPLELYLPLLVVPRAILSWLSQNIKPLKVGEHKEFKFPGQEDISIYVEKQNTDTYRGDFVQNGKLIHSFDKQTLPSIGGHLMTVGEVYDFKDKEDAAGADQLAIGKEIEKEHKETIEQIVKDVKAGTVKPFEHYFQDIAEDHLEEYKDYYTRLVNMEKEADKAKTTKESTTSGSVVSAIMGVSGVSDEIRCRCHEGGGCTDKYDAEKYKWLVSHANVKELVGVMGKLIDHFVAKEKTKVDVSDELDKEELKGDPQKVTKSPYPPKEVKDPAAKPGRYLNEGEIKEVASFLKIKPKQITHEPDAGKIVSAKAEMPSGAAAPRQAMEPRKPVPASRQPGASTNKQGQTAEKQAQASSQGKVAVAPKPKMATPAGPPASTKTGETSRQATQPPKPPVPKVSMKAEFEGRTSPSGYFKKRLNKCGVAKKESFCVGEDEVYSPCPHCGTAEFAKGEDGRPHFKPCACFKVETVDETGQDRVFVEINKNEKGFYELKFHPEAKPENIKAFLLTIKAGLLHQRKLDQRGR